MDAAQILKQSAGPAIATDSDNKIIAVNQAACQLLGLRAQHARGRSMHVLLQARDSAGNRLSTQHYAFHEMVSRSEPVRSFDIEVRRASGEPLSTSCGRSTGAAKRTRRSSASSPPAAPPTKIP
jgi:PAS domain S-box-containing protein